MNNKFIVILNPNAGNRQCGRLKKQIINLLNNRKVNYIYNETKFPVHGTLISQKYASNNFRKFIVVGGDGTLNEVVNGIFLDTSVDTKNIYIGMIPIGNGNDWAKSLKIPSDLEEAIDIIIREYSIKQDVGRIDFLTDEYIKMKYFMNIAGIGFDAEVADKANMDKELGKNGKFTYLKNLLKSFLTYKSVDTKISIQHKEFDVNLFSIAVGKGKYNGGGMMQLPNAIIDDGYLDVTIMNNITKLDVIRNLKKIYVGKHISDPKIKTFKTKYISIYPQKRLKIEFDGEVYGNTPVTITLIPKSINVYVKK